MEANALPINMDNLRATGRLVEKQVNVALEEAELNGEVIPQEVMNFLNVFQDEATRKAVMEAPDKAALQKILNDNGVPMTEENVDDFLAAVGKVGKHLLESDGKLTEEELEQISGGGWLSDAWNSVKSGVKKAWDWCTSSTVGKIIAYSVVVAGMCALGCGVATVALGFAMGGLTLGMVGMGAAMGGYVGAVVGAVVGALIE